MQQVANQSLMLYFTLRPAKMLLHDAFGFQHPSSNYSMRRRILFHYRTNRMLAGLLQSIQTITLVLYARTICLNQKRFLTYSGTKVMRRDTLLNDSDDVFWFTDLFLLSMLLRFFVHSTCDVSRFWCQPPEIFHQKHINHLFHHEITPQKCN